MDREKIIKGLHDIGRQIINTVGHCESRDFVHTIDDALALLKDYDTQLQYRYDHIAMYQAEIKRLEALLKEQEAVKPRVSTVEQRCGNCNKVIEMDGWKACPWCGKPILWEAVGRSVK